MQILIAGANGFIGKHVGKIVGDFFSLRRDNLHEVADFAPEVVINCAWDGVSGLTARSDEEIQKKNIDFNEQLFEICKPSCKRWIGVGSQLEINGPEVPYAKYKLIVLNRVEELCKQNNISFAWVRIYSIYGREDNKNNFLPFLINELLAGKDVPLTNQNIPWDYLYVEDAARAIVLLSHNKQGGIFELGSGESYMTQDVAKIIRDKINPDLKLLFGAKPCRSFELKKLIANTIRLKNIGWKPQVSLDSGLDETIKYFREKL